jgi:Zn-dependent protease with chaperone function
VARDALVHPQHTRHLPAAVEHELAHLARRDTGKRLAAGLLAVGPFAATALGAWLLTTFFRWWVEIACDLQAVRACGREAVADMWRANLAHDRSSSRPLASRVRGTLRALRTHPPLRLRVLCAMRLPVCASRAAAAHPLHAPTENRLCGAAAGRPGVARPSSGVQTSATTES